MIYQISNVKKQTEPLPTINRGLIQARHIQAKLKEKATIRVLPTEGYIESPMTAGRYLVAISRWIE